MVHLTLSGRYTWSPIADTFCSIQQDVEDNSFKFLMKDKSEALWLNDYFIPIKKYQEYQLASVMGMHHRLGQDSKWLCLYTDTVKMIWKFVEAV